MLLVWRRSIVADFYCPTVPINRKRRRCSSGMLTCRALLCLLFIKASEIHRVATSGSSRWRNAAMHRVSSNTSDYNRGYRPFLGTVLPWASTARPMPAWRPHLRRIVKYHEQVVRADCSVSRSLPVKEMPTEMARRKKCTDCVPDHSLPERHETQRASKCRV